jgi:predicted RNase H-like HicB family nuclease
MRHQFTLEYWRDGNWYVGRLIEVPGVFSQGETLAELNENIRDAYELMVTQDRPPRRRPSGFRWNWRYETASVGPLAAQAARKRVAQPA